MYGITKSKMIFHLMNKQQHRIIDQTNQEILMANTTSSKLETYCLFKLDTSCESYLNKISLNKYKFALSRFRLRSHNLALETGRYYNIPKKKKKKKNMHLL